MVGVGEKKRQGTPITDSPAEQRALTGRELLLAAGVAVAVLGLGAMEARAAQVETGALLQRQGYRMEPPVAQIPEQGEEAGVAGVATTSPTSIATDPQVLRVGLDTWRSFGEQFEE
jgi:hypothetical protein